MVERGITESDVEAALRRPVGAPQPGRRPDTIAVEGYSEQARRLKIIVDSVDRDFVITVMELGERDQ